jgi:glycosyltransferase involved in cell wall biosynthesis
VRIAFVAPFFGAKASGGAESECRQTALRLAQQPGIEVEILTTCLLDLAHGTTINVHAPGVSQDGDLVVRRFRADIFDPGPFAMLNQRLIDKEPLAPEEERHFMARHVNSFELYRFLAAESERFDWVCFIPYLFGTSCYGSQICPEKSILIPCLHDEGYARMQLVRDMVARVARIAFHTPAEIRLAEALFGKAHHDGQRLLIGEGVDVHFESDPGRFRAHSGITAPFLFYAGRKDSTKNVDTLISFFAAHKRLKQTDLKLVLVGPREAEIPSDMAGEIIDLGFVDDQVKKDAYSAALALCQPSLNESFSIVMMEAWGCSTPCLVHGGCGVTREHVERSGGGLYFETFPEFTGALDYFCANPDMCRRMGQAGKTFVNQNFEWSVIIQRYIEIAFAKDSAT